MSFADDDQGNFEIINNFITGVREFPAPDKLARGVYTNDLIDNTTYFISEIIKNFLAEYYYQASRAKAAMIRDMENAVERLTDESSMVSPEDDVKKINILLEKLINCLPGNVKIKRKELPPLPSYNRKVETHNGNEEFSSLFINLASHIDRDFASIHDLINGIFLSGWQKARLSFNKIQDQLREDELNQLVLSFAAEISKINNKQEIIQAQVTTNTWQTYNQLNQRVQLALQSL